MTIHPTPPAASPSGVVRRMEEFKAGLLARETAQTVEMTTAWFEVERSLTGSINLLVKEIDALTLAGETVTRGKVVKLDRYRELLSQARVETAKYSTEFATPFVTEGQEQVARLALSNASESIEISYATRAKFAPMFNRLNMDAVEFMVGNTGAGGPLGDLLKKQVVTGPDVMMRVRNTIVDGTARGIGSRRLAGLIANDLAGGLNKALQIARTEQGRVYRESSRMQYTDSGVVSGYKRLSAKDERTCPACLIADGETFSLEISFIEHVQGRCTLVPIVIGADEPQWETGKEWLEKQPPEVQARILGTGRFEAWQNGEFELDQLVTKKTSSVWGDSFVPTPLKDLITIPPTTKELTPSGDFKNLTKSQQEALHKQSEDALFDEIPRPQAEAVADYTEGGYITVNGDLRMDDIEASTQKTIDKINAAMDGTPNLPSDTKLYRGMDDSLYHDAFLTGKFVPGDITTDAGFMSTSLKKSVAEGIFAGGEETGIIYEILAPKGTRGVFTEPVTVRDGEQEWLLSSGTSLEIISIDTSNPDLINVVLKIVGG